MPGSNADDVVLVGWPAYDRDGNFTAVMFLAPYDLDEENPTPPGIALPAVGGNDTPMAPLVTWWAVLYTFSMLARYHPREWIDLLHLDESTYAVPATLILEKATEVVPGLIAAELDAAYPSDQIP